MLPSRPTSATVVVVAGGSGAGTVVVSVGAAAEGNGVAVGGVVVVVTAPAGGRIVVTTTAGRDGAVVVAGAAGTASIVVGAAVGGGPVVVVVVVVVGGRGATVMLPCMLGWMEQWYENVPVIASTASKNWFGFSVGEDGMRPSSNVTLCGTPPLFTKPTWACSCGKPGSGPTIVVCTLAGANPKSTMLTVDDCAAAGEAVMPTGARPVAMARGATRVAR